MFGARSRKSPEARFWEWFAQNTSDLLEVRTAREPVVDELAKQLRQVRDGLTFEFGPDRDGRREFIVSADGNKKLFPTVKRLIALAPDLKEWLLIPFRPAKKMEGMALRYGDIELSGDDIWFTHEGAGRKIHLELYLRGFSEETQQVLGGAAFLLLDGTLGEFVVETRIGGIGWHALPDDPAAQGLRPFADLSSVVSFPVRFPVSLRDALDEPGELPPATGEPAEPDSGPASWVMLQLTNGDRRALVGICQGLLASPPEP